MLHRLGLPAPQVIDVGCVRNDDLRAVAEEGQRLVAGHLGGVGTSSSPLTGSDGTAHGRSRRSDSGTGAGGQPSAILVSPLKAAAGSAGRLAIERVILTADVDIHKVRSGRAPGG